MRIAIVGAGVSGLTAASKLHAAHELTVYESDDWIGGHTHTVRVETADGPQDVDTGFVVFNEATYPEFCRLLARLGVREAQSPPRLTRVVEAFEAPTSSGLRIPLLRMRKALSPAL